MKDEISVTASFLYTTDRTWGCRNSSHPELEEFILDIDSPFNIDGQRKFHYQDKLESKLKGTYLPKTCNLMESSYSPVANCHVEAGFLSVANGQIDIGYSSVANDQMEPEKSPNTEDSGHRKGNSTCSAMEWAERLVEMTHFNEEQADALLNGSAMTTLHDMFEGVGNSLRTKSPCFPNKLNATSLIQGDTNKSSFASITGQSTDSLGQNVCSSSNCTNSSVHFTNRYDQRALCPFNNSLSSPGRKFGDQGQKAMTWIESTNQNQTEGVNNPRCGDQSNEDVPVNGLFPSYDHQYVNGRQDMLNNTNMNPLLTEPIYSSSLHDSNSRSNTINARNCTISYVDIHTTSSAPSCSNPHVTNFNDNAGRSPSYSYPVQTMHNLIESTPLVTGVRENSFDQFPSQSHSLFSNPSQSAQLSNSNLLVTSAQIYPIATQGLDHDLDPTPIDQAMTTSSLQVTSEFKNSTTTEWAPSSRFSDLVKADYAHDEQHLAPSTRLTNDYTCRYDTLTYSGVPTMDTTIGSNSNAFTSAATQPLSVSEWMSLVPMRGIDVTTGDQSHSSLAMSSKPTTVVTNASDVPFSEMWNFNYSSCLEKSDANTCDVISNQADVYHKEITRPNSLNVHPFSPRLTSSLSHSGSQTFMQGSPSTFVSTPTTNQSVCSESVCSDVSDVTSPLQSGPLSTLQTVINSLRWLEEDSTEQEKRKPSMYHAENMPTPANPSLPQTPEDFDHNNEKIISPQLPSIFSVSSSFHELTGTQEAMTSPSAFDGSDMSSPLLLSPDSYPSALSRTRSTLSKSASSVSLGDRDLSRCSSETSDSSASGSQFGNTLPTLKTDCEGNASHKAKTKDIREILRNRLMMTRASIDSPEEIVVGAKRGERGRRIREGGEGGGGGEGGRGRGGGGCWFSFQAEDKQDDSKDLRQPKSKECVYRQDESWSSKFCSSRRYRRESRQTTSGSSSISTIELDSSDNDTVSHSSQTDESPKQEKLSKQLKDRDPKAKLLRREKNRLAVLKCRRRKKDKIEILSKEVQLQCKKKSRMETEVTRLMEERDSLQAMLRVHNCVTRHSATEGTRTIP